MQRCVAVESCRYVLEHQRERERECASTFRFCAVLPPNRSQNSANRPTAGATQVSRTDLPLHGKPGSLSPEVLTSAIERVKGEDLVVARSDWCDHQANHVMRSEEQTGTHSLNRHPVSESWFMNSDFLGFKLMWRNGCHRITHSKFDIVCVGQHLYLASPVIWCHVGK